LRTLIERHGQTVSGKPVRLTTSVGIAVSQPHETLESLFQRADRALYEAKHLGRNQTMVAPVAPKVVSVEVPLP
jgi:diguanylate cyclase (GGDEF)-like protein